MKFLSLTMISSVLLLTLPACGLVETFQEMSKQTVAASTAIEKKTGNKPTIGWSINNGELTEINVYFNPVADDNLDELTLGDMKQIVKGAVDDHIEKQPKNIQIIIEANE